MKCWFVLILLLLITPTVQAQAEPVSTISTPIEAKSPYSQARWLNDAPVNGVAIGNNPNSIIVGVFVYIVNSEKYWNGAAWVVGPVFITSNINPTGGAKTVTFSYPFTPTESGEYSFLSQANDNNVWHEPSNPLHNVTVFIDLLPPKVELKKLPAWTNTPYINVEFTATDPEGMKMNFSVNYQVTQGLNEIGEPNVVEEWKARKGFLEPGTVRFHEVKNNHTYNFTVTGEDKPGNVNTSLNVSTTIDYLKPLCTILPLPEFVRSPFTLGWNAADNMSGISSVAVEYLDDNSWLSVSSGLMPGSPGKCNTFPPTASSTICGNFIDSSYQFRCSAVDNAGNIGDNSPILTLTVDSEPPEQGKIISPSSPYSNSKVFPLSWYSTDAVSGIQCYHIRWSNDGNSWTLLRNSTGDVCFLAWDTQMDFGNGKNSGPEIQNPEDNEKEFFFQLNVSDRAGNDAGWSPSHKVTMDFNNPNLTLIASESGKPFTQGVPIKKLTVNTTANDSVSGIGPYTVTIHVFGEEERIHTQKCIGKESCNLTVEVNGAPRVEYFARVEDQAGNVNQTPTHIYTLKPVANFVAHSATITTGTSHFAIIELRNINTSPMNLSILLEGYPLAGFTGSSGDFESYEILKKSRLLNTSPVQPLGTGIAMVEVVAGTPGHYILNITANSTSGISNTDGMHITVRFPTSFSGLQDWAVLLLVGLALLIYFVRSGKKYQ